MPIDIEFTTEPVIVEEFPEHTVDWYPSNTVFKITIPEQVSYVGGIEINSIFARCLEDEGGRQSVDEYLYIDMDAVWYYDESSVSIVNPENSLSIENPTIQLQAIKNIVPKDVGGDETWVAEDSRVELDSETGLIRLIDYDYPEEYEPVLVTYVYSPYNPSINSGGSIYPHDGVWLEDSIYINIEY